MYTMAHCELEDKSTNIYEAHDELRMPFHLIPNCRQLIAKVAPLD